MRSRIGGVGLLRVVDSSGRWYGYGAAAAMAMVVAALWLCFLL